VAFTAPGRSLDRPEGVLRGGAGRMQSGNTCTVNHLIRRLTLVAGLALLATAGTLTRIFTPPTTLDLTCDGGAWIVVLDEPGNMVLDCAAAKAEASPTPTATPTPTPTPTPEPAGEPTGGENLLVNPDCEGVHSSTEIRGWTNPEAAWDISAHKNPSVNSFACRLTPPDGQGAIRQAVKGQPTRFGLTFLSVGAKLVVSLDGRTIYNHSGDTSDWLTVDVPVKARDGEHVLEIWGSYEGELGLKFYGASLR
jgi:hypothetical protein